MGEVSSLQHNLPSEPQKGATQQQQQDRNEPHRGLWGKLSEHILATAITVILFGTVTALVGYGVRYFIDQIDAIQATNAKHHGSEWQTIDKVVAIGELRNEFQKAKSDYDAKLKYLDYLLTEQLTELERQSKAIAIWTRQGDTIMPNVQARQHDAYAHLSDRLPSDENVAAVKVSRVKGDSFKLNNIDA